MLTRLVVRNFKRFEEMDIELGGLVMFIGPNNSGKTSALQALTLWDAGVRRWKARYPGKTEAGKRSGVAVNRLDLLSIPVPRANLLWRGLRVRDVRRTDQGQMTSNVRMDILVEGVGEDGAWSCGMEFDYANVESLYCRPLRIDEGARTRMSVPKEAGTMPMAFLPPMSGLTGAETYLRRGALNVRLGEGRTAEVLRNLCYRIHREQPDLWDKMIARIDLLFGAELSSPDYHPERDEISMSYREGGVQLDLSSSGRGLQQTLLMLAGLYTNPGSLLLLDEPDAHLEILRQRQIYSLLEETAAETGSQIIAASHSEVLLNEAAERDMVIAFVGEPHRVDDRGSQVHKSLREIGFEHYLQAKQNGWVLYLEGSTDLAVLRRFAARLKHKRALRALARPYCHYVGNDEVAARRHFYGLREAVPHLDGIALFDRLERGSTPNDLRELTWRRREIENYLCTPEALEAFAATTAEQFAFGPLFVGSEVDNRVRAMRKSIREMEEAMGSLEKGSPWDHETKVSDDFLKPLFSAYYQRLGLPNLMRKRSFHELADFIPDHQIAPEVGEKLDAIAEAAERAQPAPTV